MDKYTPGPWAYSKSELWGDTRFYIAQQDGAPYTPNYSDVATVIADTCAGDEIAIQEANARLISASPDLLEALQEILDQTCGHAAGTDDAIWEKAASAVKKALGK